VVRRLLSLFSHRDSDIALLAILILLTFIVQLVVGNLAIALLAATLGSFAITLLRLRRSVDSLSGPGRRFADVFLSATPDELGDRIETARSVTLIGVSLDRTIRSHYASLESFLSRSGVVRMVVVDPGDERVVAIADRRAYNEHGVEHRTQQIRLAIDTMLRLADKHPGTVEVRYSPDPLTFGAAAIDCEVIDEKSWIVVQHYSYKKSSVVEANPVFVLGPSDGQWFSGFKEEIDNIWRDATPR
jgi:hypothetical protein